MSDKKSAIEVVKSKLNDALYLQGKFLDINNGCCKLEQFGGVDYNCTGDIAEACGRQLDLLKVEILALKKAVILLGGDPF